MPVRPVSHLIGCIPQEDAQVRCSSHCLQAMDLAQEGHQLIHGEITHKELRPQGLGLGLVPGGLASELRACKPSACAKPGHVEGGPPRGQARTLTREVTWRSVCLRPHQACLRINVWFSKQMLADA